MTASLDLMEGWSALTDATDDYMTALSYYKGTASERFTNAHVRELVEQAGQTYQFRLAAKPVSVMAKRCRVATVKADTEAVTRRLEEIRLANQAVIHEPMIIRKTFVFGDAFALVWPVDPSERDMDQRDGEGADTAPDEGPAAVGVEITYQSPLHCRVIYTGEDGRRARFAIRRWVERWPIGRVWRAEIHYRDRIESWVTDPGTSGGTAEEWHRYAEDDDGNSIPVDDSTWPLENPWGELAIKHFRTDLPYGEPVHAAAYGPQDAITKAITTQVVVDIEAHGWPERAVLLDDQRLLESGQEPISWGDRAAVEEATDTKGGRAYGRRRRAGVEHRYAGTRDVKELASPDPGVLIGPIDQWVRLMSVVTETPLDELDPTVQLSGVSREKADAPMRARERDLKAYLTGAWVETYALAVRMTGLDPGTIQVTWTPPEVTMDSDWWETARTRVDLGVPLRQVMAEANYLPDQVDAWLDGQGEEMALGQRIGVLERLGTAIQALGVGVQLGVLDQGTVASLVQRVVGQVESSDSGGRE